MPKKSPKDRAKSRADQAAQEGRVARQRARESLVGAQFLIGVILILSALFGIYLLATDQSLWILAASHAYGLVGMVSIDLILGVMSLFGTRQVYLPSIAAALLGVLLQVGDIATAPQYGMTLAYFASYLFGLWAFDALVASQLLVIVIGFLEWKPLRTVTSQGRTSAGFSASRRSFLKAMLASGIVIAVAAAFSSIAQSRQTLPSSPPPSQPLPSGAVANISQAQPGSPAYFEYPTGYPNILLRKGSGSDASSFLALSLLCTHVCCEVSYDSSVDQLYCPCHGSLFDNNGNVIYGPAVVSLPTVEITVDSAGNVFPQRVNGSSPCNQG